RETVATETPACSAMSRIVTRCPSGRADAASVMSFPGRVILPRFPVTLPAGHAVLPIVPRAPARRLRAGIGERPAPLERGHQGGPGRLPAGAGQARDRHGSTRDGLVLGETLPRRRRGPDRTSGATPARP